MQESSEISKNTLSDHESVSSEDPTVEPKIFKSIKYADVKQGMDYSTLAGIKDDYNYNIGTTGLAACKGITIFCKVKPSSYNSKANSIIFMITLRNI